MAQRENLSMMRNQAQLITYVNRLSGGTFRDLQRFLDDSLAGAFGGVHVLPFFHPIDGVDAGFDPIDHTQVDARLGTWADVAALAADRDVMADLIVNHVSSRSPQFRDYETRGGDSPFAGMFLTFGRVFPQGACESDLLALTGPRPLLPFTTHRNARGEQVLLWTTFTSEQVDIDVRHPEARRYLDAVMTRLHTAGVRAVRLDAVGYVMKKAGTSCFMIPETFAFIDEIARQARALDIDVLVEVHGHYEAQVDVARRVDWVYDFALPPLMLHTLYSRDATRLTKWLRLRPHNAVTVLDTHDGIGVADVAADRDRRRPGLLSAEEIDRLVATIHERSRGESRTASGLAAQNVDAHQINCTFYDALGRRDDEYLVARAIQCFVPGIPQIYYVGLFAGVNDVDLLRRTGVGRDINRHYYSAAELRQALTTPVVRALLALLRIRNIHPAFGGAFRFETPTQRTLTLVWDTDDASARLDVDLTRMSALVTAARGGESEDIIWHSTIEAPLG